MSTCPDIERAVPAGSPLLGSWLLVSCTMTRADGSVIMPYGAQPDGIILYSADGWMACQMAGTNGSGGFEALSAYHARFSVDPERAIVTHHVAWSSASSVSGDAMRHYRVKGNSLTLTAPAEGSTVEVRWRKP